MTHFHRSIVRFAHFSNLRSLRWLPVLAAFAAATVPVSADAATRVKGGGAYDGTWNVVFATTKGNCSSGYSVPFQVVNTSNASPVFGTEIGALPPNV